MLPRPILLAAHLIALAVALLAISQTKHETWFITAATGVAVFFTSAMVAHRTLYEARPAARYLTEFYLWMSFGGALGGLAAALVAPKIFSEVFEYPLLLALSMACRPGVFAPAALRRLGGTLTAWSGRLGKGGAVDGGSRLTEADKQEMLIGWLIIAGGLLAIYWVPWAIGWLNLNVGEWGSTPVVVALLVIILFSQFRRPVRQLLAALMIFSALVLLALRREAGRGATQLFRCLSRADLQRRRLPYADPRHHAARRAAHQG